MKRYTHINEAAAQYDPSTFEQFCKEQYIASESKNYLNIDVIMPDFRNWYIPAAPTDLKALMQNLSATEERLFKNINNMMSDPTTTYNAAEDYATEAFGSLKGKISLVRADYLKESLNEGIGDAVGSIASSALDGLASVATSLGKAIAPAGAGAYGLGYATGYFGDAGGPNYYNDDALDANSNAVKNTEQALDNSSFQGQDAIEAIDTYVNNVVNSLAGLDTIFGCSPEAYVKFKTLVQSALNNCGVNVKEFVKKNDVILKELENNLAKTRNSQLNAKFHKQAIITEFYKLCADHADIFSEKTKQTMLSYVANFKNDDYTSALKFYQKTKELLKDIGGANQEVINNFLFNVNEHVTQMPIGESVNYQGHHLNEADSAIPKKPVIDCTDFYNRVHAELSKSIEGILSVSGSKIPGVAEAQKEMQELLTKATQEINTKIEQVCRTSTTDTGGVFANVSKFLSKHPMKADELKNLWGRYASVLQQRMDNRIRQMGDTRDKTKAVGWSYAVIRNVVPTTIARMLTYKYLLLFLKEKNVYSFTPRLQQTLDREWNKQKQTIMNQDEYFFKDILMHYTSALTNDGKNILQLDMNGKVAFTGSNNLTYLSCALIALNDTFGRVDVWAIYNALWPLYEQDDAEGFLKQFITEIRGIQTLSTDFTNLYTELVETFKLKDLDKNELNTAYQLVSKEPDKFLTDEDFMQKKIGYIISYYHNYPKEWSEFRKKIDSFITLYKDAHNDQLIESLNKIQITGQDFIKFIPTTNLNLNVLYQHASKADYFAQTNRFFKALIPYAVPFNFVITNAIVLAKYIASDFINVLIPEGEASKENFDKINQVLNFINEVIQGNVEPFIKLCDTYITDKDLLLTTEQLEDYILSYNPTYTTNDPFIKVLDSVEINPEKLFTGQLLAVLKTAKKVSLYDLISPPLNMMITDVLPDEDVVKTELIDILTKLLNKLKPEMSEGAEHVTADFATIYDNLHWTMSMARKLYDICDDCPADKKALAKIYKANKDVISGLIRKVNKQFVNETKGNIWAKADETNINNIVELLDEKSYDEVIKLLSPQAMRVCINMEQTTNINDKIWGDYVKLKTMLHRLMPTT